MDKSDLVTLLRSLRDAAEYAAKGVERSPDVGGKRPSLCEWHEYVQWEIESARYHGWPEDAASAPDVIRGDKG